MSKNIKEIGKELLGKSLNSFHRKTGLTQLEKNNEMQDGILDGILSQVDDAYIEKTEQSNVIHLDGSGDGVVVLDSIEGNTMVNLATTKSVTLSGSGSKVISNLTFKQNTKYTLIFDVDSNTVTDESHEGIYLWFTADATVSSMVSALDLKGKKRYVITRSDKVDGWGIGCRNTLSGTVTLNNILILEGDWTDKEIPATYFEGVQSSFEEKVNDDGKYEIEILLNNKNLINSNDFILGKYVDRAGVLQNCIAGYENYGYIPFIKVKEEFQYTLSPLNTGHYDENSTFRIGCYNYSKQCISVITVNKNTTHTFTTPKNTKYIQFTCTKEDLKTVSLSYGNKIANIDHKYNKIKLLINEPLRSVGNVKDRLCIKDNTLVVERNFVQILVNGENLQNYSNFAYRTLFDFKCNVLKNYHLANFITDSRFKNSFTDYQWNNRDEESIAVSPIGEGTCIDIIDKSIPFSVNSYKEHLKEKPIKVVCQLLEPYYEEVTNEYGEPIILEGYENGTLYIDSTIIPTTTVKYTPKMESFNTLKEVTNNNIMLTNDVNDNIIPYMMDVDYMIMEKELCLLNTKNIRKMEVLDMTSMQKRTQDMLERLIKGKSLTEQECKTRVTTYLNAGKITDEQAEELMLLIDEVYA